MREPNCVSFSGGKDSTAMLLMLLEKGERVDNIVYFDSGTWEWPQMRTHKEKVENYIGRKIHTVHPDRTFDYLMFEHKVRSRGGIKVNYVGLNWPRYRRRWCTQRKIRAIQKYQTLLKRENGGVKPIQLIGFAYDEIKRTMKKGAREGKRYPLVEYKMTERDCLQFCYDRGFDWEGLYEHTERLSCWCCPFQTDKAMFGLWKYFPERWEILKQMERRAGKKFKHRESLEEYESIFENQDEINLFSPRQLKGLK